MCVCYFWLGGEKKTYKSQADNLIIHIHTLKPPANNADSACSVFVQIYSSQTHARGMRATHRHTNGDRRWRVAVCCCKCAAALLCAHTASGRRTQALHATLVLFVSPRCSDFKELLRRTSRICNAAFAGRGGAHQVVRGSVARYFAECARRSPHTQHTHTLARTHAALCRHVLSNTAPTSRAKRALVCVINDW